MKRRMQRRGVTLIEVLAILAIVVVVGAVAGPTLLTMTGNAKQKAAADLVKSRIADARGRAIGDGIPYRLAIHQDGTRIRLAPDGPTFTNAASDPGDGSPIPLVREDALDTATAALDYSSDDMMSSDGSGWNTIATFMPDGTCKEATATVTLNETGFPPMYVYLRGLTGVSKTVTSNGGAVP